MCKNNCSESKCESKCETKCSRDEPVVKRVSCPMNDVIARQSRAAYYQSLVAKINGMRNSGCFRNGPDQGAEPDLPAYPDPSTVNSVTCPDDVACKPVYVWTVGTGIPDYVPNFTDGITTNNVSVQRPGANDSTVNNGVVVDSIDRCGNLVHTLYTCEGTCECDCRALLHDILDLHNVQVPLAQSRYRCDCPRPEVVIRAPCDVCDDRRIIVLRNFRCSGECVRVYLQNGDCGRVDKCKWYDVPCGEIRYLIIENGKLVRVTN
jgi:hypothetical protein